jgi:tetratricopeptide (TPR) repeat protein
VIRRTQAGGAKKRPARYGLTSPGSEAALALAHRAHRKHRWAEATVAYRAVLASDPTCVDAWMNLGAALVALGRAREAAEAFAEACHRSRDDARVARDAAIGLDAIGRRAEARALLEHALERSPGLVGAHLVLSRVCLELGDVAAATTWARTAIEIAPRQASAYLELYRAAFDGRAVEVSIEAAERAVSLDPEYLLARYFLGAARAWSGDAAGARRALDPSTPGAPPSGWVDGLEYALEHRADGTRVFASSRATLEEAVAACTLEGPVLELGVRHGISTRVLAERVDVELFAFDSFVGLPEPWLGRDAGAFSTAGCTPELPDHVKLRAGWFEQTLPAYLLEDERAPRLVHVDSDLYSSAAMALSCLGPRIESGCVLVFDEYFGNERWREDEHRAYLEAERTFGWTREWVAWSWVTGQAVFRIRR